MVPSDDLLDADFDAQMRGLSQEAEESIVHHDSEGKKEGKGKAVTDPDFKKSDAASKPAVSPPSLLQLLKPIALGLESVSRATAENTAILKKLEAATGGSPGISAGDLPQVTADLRAMLESKNGLSQSMFKALHDELKDYKDEFLLQAVQRPIIRDLIYLFDDVSEIQRQIGKVAEGVEKPDEKKSEIPVGERLRQIEANLANNLHFILEVLNRLDVSPVDISAVGKLDKVTQKAVSVENAANEGEDGMVVRTVKQGFNWKETILRPEEVVIKKWKSPSGGDQTKR